MALEEYERKRRFPQTPEPGPHKSRKAASDERMFVVQLHHARARHYDFRLEVDGVLRSWAVPKGPSLRPGEKRLAVEVEDHPLSYAGFEGTIPEGNYGAGHVAIFDHGTWAPVDDPVKALAAGKLEFDMQGERLKGRWTLIRTRKTGSKPQWILLKRSDAHAADMDADAMLDQIPAPPPDSPGASTAKGRRIHAEHARSASVDTEVNVSRSKVGSPRVGATKRSVIRQDEFIAPMLTTPADKAPESDDWLHEWKWDGYRLIAVSGETPVIWSRNGLPWQQRVPEITRALQALPSTATLDGELIAVNAQGYSDFNALQQALKSQATSQLRYVVFDLLALDGHDLRQLPLLERKTLLQTLLTGADPRLFFSEHVQGRGTEVFDTAVSRSMEGIISKRADSVYVSGRSKHWLKIKAVETREFVIVGYTQPKGSRKGVGALLLAQHEAGQLKYTGRVGSGISDEMLADLHSQLRALQSPSATVPLPDHVPLPAGKIHWVEPSLVVEVFFRGWGKEGLLRQASFHRLRSDKPATIEATAPQRPLVTTSVRISSADRVVYPDAGITKQQVFDYYLSVADRVLDDMGGRLLSIVRCPDGVGGQHFFQKHAGPGFGAAVKRKKIVENDGDAATYFCVDDVEGLMNLVQMNALEFHPWGSKVDQLEKPDRMIFDLDPDTSVSWPTVRAAALELRDRLQSLGLPSWPRLSGGKGVHVVVPLTPHADWTQVRHFCEAFADAMATEQPQRYVATMSKAKREGRIFIDWLRNGRGATAISSWSLRARRGAPAAMPLDWEALTGIRQPGCFTLKDAADYEWPPLVRALLKKPPRLPL